MNVCSNNPMIQIFKKISAVLKIGKLNTPMFIKSLTPPSHTLSIRFPKVPAKKNPRKIRQIFLFHRPAFENCNHFTSPTLAGKFVLTDSQVVGIHPSSKTFSVFD
jgi:hypothetical protein